MKIGIIGFANLRYMTYLNYYTYIFDRCNLNYEIIYWNRLGLIEKWHAKTFAFVEKMGDSSSVVTKIIPMLRFRNFAVSKIMERKYDFLVILTTMPAILLSDFIKKIYPYKYVIDIRDYTYEKLYGYRQILTGILRKAAMRVISSPAFKNFLPADKYIVCHNFCIPKFGNRNIRDSKPRSKNVLNISYIGAIAYFLEVKKLIDAIANDARFLFSFYGAGIDEHAIRAYCSSKGIKNVHFHGMYQPIDKEGFYGETDIVYNAYGNNSLIVRYALSNKLYDAAWYRIPILISPATAMSEMSGYIGFELDFKKTNIADELHYWYNELIDWEKFKTASDNIINWAYEDNKKFEQNLLEALNVAGIV
jgi:hypothetical protein